jgi:hypothetical protein
MYRACLKIPRGAVFEQRAGWRVVPIIGRDEGENPQGEARIQFGYLVRGLKGFVRVSGFGKAIKDRVHSWDYI